MKWMIETTSLPGYILVTAEGKLTFESFAAMWEDIFAHGSWQSGTCILLDGRGLEPLDHEGFRLAADAANFFADMSEGVGDSRIAFLIDRREDFKYLRQFQFSIKRRAPAVNFQIFLDEAQAVNWLNYVCHDQEPELQLSAA